MLREEGVLATEMESYFELQAALAHLGQQHASVMYVVIGRHDGSLYRLQSR